MKLHKKVVWSVVILALCAACAPKTLPPELKPAYTANEVLIRVQELQNTVIGLYDATPRGITKQRADLIVKFCVSSAEVIQQSRTGWQSTVKSAWTELNKQIKVPEQGLDTVWRLVDALISAL